MKFVVANTARHSLPRVPFSMMKGKVLGAEYSLSLVFIPPRKMQELNRQYRRKNVPTDILSFPLSKKTGEIYICMSVVKKKAPQFKMNTSTYLPFLFVHGMLHLQGHDHSKKMEALEKKFCKILKIPNPY